ncbi:MAG TPA: preprotein translocase subunit SecY, partial [Halobacteria archaeon]|nr:preprotein translocase subunit SecY [Halobacteria archaeon]
MTGFRSTIDSLFRIIPTVKKPIGHVHFRTKLGWTIGILLLYFILMEIPMIGISPESIDYFGAFRAIMGGSNGSIIHLGIGPIVMASIILQLLVGAKIINLNLGDPNDQRFYQGMQRVLVMIMIVLESLPLLIGGVILPDPVLVATLGRPVVLLLLFVQLFIGGLLILYMDEVVSKWGIGSGISLFILAGVAQSLIIGLFNW